MDEFNPEKEQLSRHLKEARKALRGKDKFWRAEFSAAELRSMVYAGFTDFKQVIPGLEMIHPGLVTLAIDGGELGPEKVRGIIKIAEFKAKLHTPPIHFNLQRLEMEVGNKPGEPQGAERLQVFQDTIRAEPGKIFLFKTSTLINGLIGGDRINKLVAFEFEKEMNKDLKKGERKIAIESYSYSLTEKNLFRMTCKAK